MSHFSSVSYFICIIYLRHGRCDLGTNVAGDDRLHSSWTKFQYDVKEKIHVPPIDLNHSSENGRIAEEYSAPSNVSTPSSETLLDLVIDHFSDPAQRHRSHTRQKFGNGSAGAPPTAVIPEQKFVVVRAAVFLDDAMMEQLGKETQHYVHHANYVSLVFSAVNQLFDDGAFGAHRPYVNVVKIIFGTNDTAFFDEDPLNGETGPSTADAEVEHYLRSLCAFQTKLKRDAMGEHRSTMDYNESSNWDIFVGLTGLDLWVSYQKFARTDHYGEHDDSSQSDSSQVMGVTGVAYEGSACNPDKNCAVIEFTRGIKVVDTITHEIAHMLGIVHDASKNPNHPCYEKRKTVMARDFGNSRKGWSPCSANSFKEWMSRASKPECKNCPDRNHCDPMQCGGFCLNAHQYFNVNGADRLAHSRTFSSLLPERFRTIGHQVSLLLLLLLFHRHASSL